ncbi:unnamed protein product [Linum trigynum]|uniref:Uncharacterized protein n=1 Tax=Linum trigynum TaxID=586398 RepID=A0AAV2GAZ2_9ROSI
MLTEEKEAEAKSETHSRTQETNPEAAPMLQVHHPQFHFVVHQNCNLLAAVDEYLMTIISQMNQIACEGRPRKRPETIPTTLIEAKVQSKYYHDWTKPKWVGGSSYKFCEVKGSGLSSSSLL